MTAASGDTPLEMFAQFTDPIAMSGIWRKQLPALLGSASAFTAFTACNVHYARCRTYLKPRSWHKSYLCVSYEFDVAADKHAAYKPMLYGRVYLDGRSRKEFDALTNQIGAQVVPELDMLVWAFPHDPHLPQLPELLDARNIASCFPYDNLPFSADAIHAIKIDVMRYRPEQRCILRYDILFGAQRGHFILYAKVFADDNGEQVFSRMQHCHMTANALGVRVARPLGYHSALRTVWQEELSGTPPTVMMETGNYAAPMAAIGHCLAKLHAARLPIQKTISRDGRLADAGKKARKLAQLMPYLADDLEVIIARAQADLPSLPAVQLSVIHGDVHFGQFLITADNALALFDFDEWSLGDPAQDLADLIVDPHVSKFARDKTEMNTALSSEVTQVLIASYRRHADTPVSDAAIAWHARIQLINKAYRAAIQLEPHWREKVPALLALAGSGIHLGRETEKEMAP